MPFDPPEAVNPRCGHVQCANVNECSIPWYGAIIARVNERRAAPVRRSFWVRLTNYRGIAHPSAIRNMMRAIAHWYGFTGWRFHR